MRPLAICCGILALLCGLNSYGKDQADKGGKTVKDADEQAVVDLIQALNEMTDLIEQIKKNPDDAQKVAAKMQPIQKKVADANARLSKLAKENPTKLMDLMKKYEPEMKKAQARMVATMGKGLPPINKDK